MVPLVFKSNWKSLGWIIKIRLDFLWGCWGPGLGRGVGDTPGLVLDKTWIIPNRNRTFLLSLSCWASWRRDTDLQIKWCCNANNFNTWLCPCSRLGPEERWIIVQIGGVVRCKGGVQQRNLAECDQESNVYQTTFHLTTQLGFKTCLSSCCSLIPKKYKSLAR